MISNADGNTIFNAILGGSFTYSSTSTPPPGPTGSGGSATICQGNVFTFPSRSCSSGTLRWYENSSGTGSFHMTSSVSPTSTTTYYPFCYSTCLSSVGNSATATIASNSVAPTSIIGTSTICSGSSTTLTLSSGSPGTGATAQWFSGSCEGISVGTGNSITVSPTSNTTYFVRYSGTCNVTSCDSQIVTVNSADDASFSYSGGTYCVTGSDPVPTISGLSGGTFSINNGGVINSSTGVINLSSSGIGPYVVSYLTNGSCPIIKTVSLSITSSPTSDFSYSGSPYCINGPNPEVTFSTGASGGVFSDHGATGTLTINSSTGEIDLSSTEVGTYTIQNNILASGGCTASSSTTSVIITPEEDASFSYSKTSFCEGDANLFPTISGATGGVFTSTPIGLSINSTIGEVTTSTSTLDIDYTVTYTTSGSCPGSEEQMLIINTVPITPTVTTSDLNNSICEGESIDILATGSGSNITYNVYDALTNGALLGSTDLTVSPTTTTDYFIEAKHTRVFSNNGKRANNNNG